MPSVDLFVTSKLAVPFFIFESKSNAGNLRTAENQMATAMVQAHDILCSLDVQASLYILGMVQCALIAYPYVSFSCAIVDADGKSYCNSVSTPIVVTSLADYQIRIVRLKLCDLSEADGLLRCLRFTEYVKTYGSGRFHNIITEKLGRLPVRV